MNVSGVRVVVADDHPVFRDGLVELLRSQPDLDLVAAVGDGRIALEAIRAERPAVAVLDLQLPELDGVAVLEAMQREHLTTLGVIVSAYHDSATVYRAIESGARAYLAKTASGDAICAAVRAVARGETVLPPEVQAGLAAEIRARRQLGSTVLSPRELDILRLAADGLATAEIARELHISPATVKSHLQHAFEKLEVSDRAAAVAQALRRGLLR